MCMPPTVEKTISPGLLWASLIDEDRGIRGLLNYSQGTVARALIACKVKADESFWLSKVGHCTTILRGQISFWSVYVEDGHYFPHDPEVVQGDHCRGGGNTKAFSIKASNGIQLLISAMFQVELTNRHPVKRTAQEVDKSVGTTRLAKTEQDRDIRRVVALPGQFSAGCLVAKSAFERNM